MSDTFIDTYKCFQELEILNIDSKQSLISVSFFYYNLRLKT